MSKISKDLVVEKLVDWTPSNKVQELLGLSSMDEDSFKKEFSDLEKQGLVIRDGARRGLKFKAATSDSIKVVKPEPKKEEPVAAVTTTEDPVKVAKKKKHVTAATKADIKDIECEITIFPQHELMSAVTHVSVPDLLSFMLDGSSDSSRAISIKKTSKGIIVKTYRDIFCLSEVTYTKENFKKLLKLSDICLD